MLQATCTRIMLVRIQRETQHMISRQRPNIGWLYCSRAKQPAYRNMVDVATAEMRGGTDKALSLHARAYTEHGTNHI